MNIEQIPVGKIRPDPEQPRQTLDKDRIADMAQSMKTEGVINPIEVDKQMVIITGEMRWRAAREAGLKQVPCKVLDLNPRERFRRQVIENIHHNTMTDWDTAKALKKMLSVALETLGGRSKSGGYPDQGISKVAKLLGKSKRYVFDHLDLLEAPKDLRESIKKGDTPYTFIRAIKRVPDEFKEAMEKKILAGEFSNRDAAVHVANAISHHPEKAKELLAQNYHKYTFQEVVARVAKIVPSAVDRLQEAYDPVKELFAINHELQKWIKTNHPHTLGKLFGSRVVITFSAMVEAMNEWMKVGKQINAPKIRELKGK